MSSQSWTVIISWETVASESERAESPLSWWPGDITGKFLALFELMLSEMLGLMSNGTAVLAQDYKGYLLHK